MTVAAQMLVAAPKRPVAVPTPKEKVRRFLFRDGDTCPAFTRWTSAATESSYSLEWDDPLRSVLIATSSSPPTPLFLACSLGLLSVMDDVSAFKNFHWNQRNRIGDTGLHLAASKGHVEVVHQLLDKGAELETKDKYGRTPLSYAVEGRHQAVVDVLESAQRTTITLPSSPPTTIILPPLI